MKNGSFESSECNLSDRNERAKKVYRYVSDVVRRIGDVSTEGRTIGDLFSSAYEVQRQKLRDNCEKLFFLDPLNYGKKSLELLWRKVYYDVVSAAKKLKETDSKYDGYLFTHIMSGMGQFHHIITRIQSEMNIQLKGLDYLPLYGEDIDDATIVKFSDEEYQLGRTAIYLCLIYLGDLSRYQAEMFDVFDASIAARYYLQAAQIDLTLGMPFNQLGNLYLEKNYNLDSVYWYIRCLSCMAPFEGGLGNLTKIFEKNKIFCDTLVISEPITRAEHVQNTVANFLLLIEIWYLNKDDVHVTKICSTVVQQLKIGMDFPKIPFPDINDNYTDFTQALEEESMNPSYFNTNILHNMVQICLFTIAKMTETDNLKTFACKAFTLAIFSQMLQKLLKKLETLGLKSPVYKYIPKAKLVTLEPHLEACDENQPSNEDAVPDIVKCNGEDIEHSHNVNGETKPETNGDVKSSNKKVLAKRRRRRRVGSSGSSDLSDEDTEISEVNTDLSSSENDLSDSSYESEDDGDSKSEGSPYTGSDDEIEVSNKINGNAKVNGEHDGQEIYKSDATKQPEPKPVTNNKGKKNDTCLNSENMTYNVLGIQKFLLGDNILPSIKLLEDWLLNERDLILSCGASGESLFQCVVDLLNIFTIYFESGSIEELGNGESKVFDTAKRIARKFKLEYKTIPLPEDIALRGTNICKFDKDASEWQIFEKPTVYEENIIRILNFIDFGNHIAEIVPQIRYNKYTKTFYLKKVLPKVPIKISHKKNREWHNSNKQENGDSEGGGGLLQRMGRLWLASQVRELERSGRAPEPTLLVVDSAALNKYLRRVKQFMRASNFVVLVPTVVLQELDNLKCERSSARDAIRWLEAELKSGSRFLKTQRNGQSRPIPLLKYPRKAPAHVHNFISVLEFCNHFIGDERHTQNGNGDSENPLHGKTAPLLILLVGNEIGNAEDQCKDFSFRGAAQAAGVPMEFLGDFYTKWRRTAYKSGKKR